MKKLKILSMMLVAMVLPLMVACGDDDNGGINNKVTIVGTWVDGSTTMTLGSDNSYYLVNASVPGITQYRKGTYSYNANQGIMTVSVVAVEGQNGAYQQTYIVQTLTSTSLVLLYLDGTAEGYYTRK